MRDNFHIFSFKTCEKFLSACCRAAKLFELVSKDPYNNNKKKTIIVFCLHLTIAVHIFVFAC